MALQIVPSNDRPREVACDALVVAATSTDDGAVLSAPGRAADEALDGYIVRHLTDSGFKAKVGEMTLIPTLDRMPARAVAVVGLGPQAEVGPAAVRRAAGIAARRLADRTTIASALHVDASDAAEAAAEGFLLGGYRFTRYRSDGKPVKLERILFLDAGSEQAIARAEAIASATTLARDLTNEPASTLTPERLAERAQEIADVGGLECTIFDESELRERGFGGILGVAQGSDKPPRLIKLRYVPDDPTGRVALVGKGITFDSGGLSLKDAKNMETMKTDMAGAAAVIATMSALARLRPRVEVIAFAPATENMPGGRAIKPGDVLTHYGGKTSEVLNTDAEGRLVLADALVFACEHEPDAIVDVATLTGAIMVALGRKVSGLFANDEALRAEIEEAALAAGERVWPMPMPDDYRADIDSEIADIKNTGGRYGGAIYAALFLRDFVADGVPWAHLDIAGAARAEGDYDEVTKGGSGVATRTLIRWIERRGH